MINLKKYIELQNIYEKPNIYYIQKDMKKKHLIFYKNYIK